MATEKTKNSDYSLSAVNLTNPLPVAELIFQRRCMLGLISGAREAMGLDKMEADLKALDETIKKAIDEHGSYQDQEDCEYAIKQRRITYTFSPDLVRLHLSEYANALIEETVNEKKLAGLIKGGLVDPEIQPIIVGESQEKYAYIIRSGE